MTTKKSNRFEIRQAGTILTDTENDFVYRLELDEDNRLSVWPGALEVPNNEDAALFEMDEEETKALCAAMLGMFKK